MEWEFWRIFVVVLVAKSCMALCDPMDCKPPGSSVMGFFKQEYWGGLPFPSPGDLPNPGIEPTSPALAGRFFTPEPPGKPDHQKENEWRCREAVWNSQHADALVHSSLQRQEPTNCVWLPANRTHLEAIKSKGTFI